jgi:hypothetical protein
MFTGLAFQVWLQRENEYIKPLGYYIFSAIGLAGVFCIVLFCGKSKWYTALILFSACFVGLMHVWTEALMFPSLIGLDTWTHYRVTMQELQIAIDGQQNIYGIVPLGITTIGGYFSLMHWYLKTAIDITGLDYKYASLIFVGSLQTIGNILLSYLIGRELFNTKIGLIAALMCSVACWSIFFGIWVIPNGIGALLSLIVVYVFIRSYKANSQYIAWLSLVILIAALLIHIVVSLWVIGTILCMTVCIFTFEFMNRRGILIE